MAYRKAAPNKQLQRPVVAHRGDAARAPFHYARASRSNRQRAAAELRRYAASFVVTALAVVLTIAPGSAAEPLESVRLVNGGAIVVCDYTEADVGLVFTCRDAYTVFALRCRSVAWSGLTRQRTAQQEFLCPVSAEQSAFGNGLRLRCTRFDAAYFDYFRVWKKEPNPRLLLEGRTPTHQCESAKVDV